MLTLQDVRSLPPMDKTKAIVAMVFSGLVGIGFLVSLTCMMGFRVSDPNADITLWVNVFLTCLGYIVGILTGLFGIPTVAPPK